MSGVNLFHIFMTLMVLGLGALYAGLVVVTYWMSGSQFVLRLNWRDPLRFFLGAGVWAGVKLLDAVIKLAQSTYDLLVETSAELGEKVLRHHRNEV